MTVGKIENKQGNLPKGWVSYPVGDLIKVKKDKLVPSKSKNQRWIGLEHIEKNSGNLIGFGNSRDQKTTKAVFKSGDVLYGRLRPYLNKVHVPSFDGVCSTDILVFSTMPTLINRYLALFLLSDDFVAYATANMAGVNHPRVSIKAISKFLLPIPPLAEQRRIVARVESIFAQIDAARGRLERLAARGASSPGSLEALRAGALKAAFEGRLVPQDPCNKTATDSTKSVLGHSDLNQNKKLPKNWIVTTIGNVCTTKSGGTPSRKNPKYFCGNIPWIKSGELNQTKIISSEEKISNLGLENSNATIYPVNTILMAMYGASIGKVSVLGCSAATNQAICAFFPNEKIIDRMYLFQFLKSIKSNLINIGVGAAQNNISQEKINQIKIMIPPIVEQKCIVKKLESILGGIDAMNESVNKSLKALDDLKQSVLKRAFEGKLVPQDPSDEPASALLEKIRNRDILAQKPPKGRKNVK